MDSTESKFKERSHQSGIDYQRISGSMRNHREYTHRTKSTLPECLPHCEIVSDEKPGKAAAEITQALQSAVAKAAQEADHFLELVHLKSPPAPAPEPVRALPPADGSEFAQDLWRFPPQKSDIPLFEGM